MNFHEWTNGDGEVLVLRRIPQNRTTRNNFVWPAGVGAVVEEPQWEPKPVCGGGLHGWPWGFGLGDGCDYDIINDIWLVVGAAPGDVVGELGGGAKCKFRRGTIRMEGTFGAAMEFVRDGFGRCVAAMATEAQPTNSSTAASSGNYSKAASSGDYSTAASSGNSSKAASSGDYSTAASSGNSSTAASSGDYSKAASSGNSSTAASSGDGCECVADGTNTCAAIAGGGGRVRVGERGALALAYYSDNDGWRFVTGKVGENGVKADTWYEVHNGELREVNQQ